MEEFLRNKGKDQKVCNRIKEVFNQRGNDKSQIIKNKMQMTNPATSRLANATSVAYWGNEKTNDK